MLEHNMGWHYGSLHVLLGSMSKSSAKTLLWLRSESIRRATHTGNKRNTRLTRASLKGRHKSKGKAFYDPGMMDLPKKVKKRATPAKNWQN